MVRCELDQVLVEALVHHAVLDAHDEVLVAHLGDERGRAAVGQRLALVTGTQLADIVICG